MFGLVWIYFQNLYVWKKQKFKKKLKQLNMESNLFLAIELLTIILFANFLEKYFHYYDSLTRLSFGISTAVFTFLLGMSKNMHLRHFFPSNYFGCDFSDSCPHLYCDKLKHNVSAAVSSGLPQVSLVYLSREMIQTGKLANDRIFMKLSVCKQ